MKQAKSHGIETALKNYIKEQEKNELLKN